MFYDKLITNNMEILVVLVFLAVLLEEYTGMLAQLARFADENQNFIPDAWEEKYSWFFSGKGIIMLVLGIGIGYALAKSWVIT